MGEAVLFPGQGSQFAGMGKETTVVGSGPRIEIWSTEVWGSEEAAADEYYSGIEEVLGWGGGEL